MKMNIANRLTILRILLIVPFILILLWKSEKFSYRLIAFVIFAIASLTDFLDGYLARKFNLVTNFGKLMDPLADKILVISSLLIFVELKYVPAWMVIVIITRDFLINGIRSLAASKGKVLPAGMLGKIKTTTQMIAILLIILLGANVYNFYIMLIPVFFTIISAVVYIIEGKNYIND
jgi:CDP-diacylglycerol--glycerol-3-phosphate 3-phosphatidyltransferase